MGPMRLNLFCLKAVQHPEHTSQEQRNYTEMLLKLDKAAAEATRTALHESTELTEPFVAYEVARTLPAGEIIAIYNCKIVRYQL